MSRLSQRFSVGKLIVPAFAASVVIIFGTMNACTPSDQGTEVQEEDAVVKNAAEAEAAEEKVAKENQTKDAKDEKTVKGNQAAGKGKHRKTEKVEAGVAQGNAPVAISERHRSPASAGGVYVVQVGAFKQKENAERLEARLKTAGYQVATHTIEHSKNGLLHLVQFEPTANRAEAETQIEELQAKQDLAAQLLVEHR